MPCVRKFQLLAILILTHFVTPVTCLVSSDPDPPGSRHTLDLYFNQDFFNRLTSELIEPYLSGLTKRPPKNLTNEAVHIGNEFVIYANVTNITFDHASF